MNFCFNCGAKLVEEDQKFCIQCGAELRREDENPVSGNAESGQSVSNYNDYFENSDTEEEAFGKDDIENNNFLNCEDDFDEEDLDKLFNHLKGIAHDFVDKESILNDAAIEEFSNALFNGSPDRDDEIEEFSNAPFEDSSDGDDSSSIVISEYPSGKPIAYVSNNMVKKSAFGRPMYYINGNYVLDGPMGKPVYYIDGDYIKKGNVFGRVVYVIDGNFIKEGDLFGKVVAKMDKLTFGY